MLLLVRYARGWALRDLHGVNATRSDRIRGGARVARAIGARRRTLKKRHRAGMRRFWPKRTFRRTRRTAAPARSGMPRRRERRCCA